MVFETRQYILRRDFFFSFDVKRKARLSLNVNQVLTILVSVMSFLRNKSGELEAFDFKRDGQIELFYPGEKCLRFQKLIYTTYLYFWRFIAFKERVKLQISLFSLIIITCTTKNQIHHFKSKF